MKTPPQNWDDYFQAVTVQIGQQSAVVDKKNVALRMAVYLFDLQPDPATIRKGVEIINEVLKLR